MIISPCCGIESHIRPDGQLVCAACLRMSPASVSVLQEADEIINGPRRDAYGPVEESFGRIAQVWSAILKVPVTSHQVALCMAGLKLCRESNKAARDNRVDAAGYIALADKVAPK